MSLVKLNSWRFFELLFLIGFILMQIAFNQKIKMENYALLFIAHFN